MDWSGVGQGLSQGIQNVQGLQAIQTGQQHQAVQKQQMDLQAIQLREAQKKEEFLNTPIDLSYFDPMKKTQPELYQQLYDRAKSLKLIENIGDKEIIRERGKQNLFESMHNDYDFSMQALKNSDLGLGRQEQRMKEDLADLNEKVKVDKRGEPISDDKLSGEIAAKTKELQSIQEQRKNILKTTDETVKRQAALEEKKAEDARILQTQKDAAAMERTKVTVGGKPVKGYESMEEAVKEAQRVLSKTGKSAGLVATAEMGMGNKWIPKLVPDITQRIPPETPTTTPGIGFDKRSGQWYENLPDGKRRVLSSAEVNQRRLTFLEETPVTDIKVMQQSVPSVLQLIKQSRTDMKNALSALGPAAGRWSQFYSGKVGASNPEFRRLMTDIGLLQTRLMKMHVGARGGVEMMTHFRQYFDAAKDSPENLNAAFNAVEEYAKEVGSPMAEQKKAIGAGVQTPNKNSKGWMLHTDAQGNKAYVSPDGKQYEEVK